MLFTRYIIKSVHNMYILYTHITAYIFSQVFFFFNQNRWFQYISISFSQDFKVNVPVFKKLWYLESINTVIEFFRLSSFLYCWLGKNRSKCLKKWKLAGKRSGGCCKHFIFQFIKFRSNSMRFMRPSVYVIEKK